MEHFIQLKKFQISVYLKQAITSSLYLNIVLV
jgi:hypothetical protein